MAIRQAAFQVYLAIDLLFNEAAAPLTTARHKLSQRKLQSKTHFSEHCHLAERLLNAFQNASSPPVLDSSTAPSLSSITPLIPTFLVSSTADAHALYLQRLFTPSTSALNWAGSLMLQQICTALASKQSTPELLEALQSPIDLPSPLNPKWWWLMAQCIKILNEYSSKPALELLNKSLQPEVAIQVNSLDHPIWGTAYLFHHASKSTILQDLEHLPVHSISTGATTLLGMLMWLYSPELFPPPWLRQVAVKRYMTQQAIQTEQQQLRLFEDDEG